MGLSLLTICICRDASVADGRRNVDAEAAAADRASSSCDASAPLGREQGRGGVGGGGGGERGD